MITPQQVDNHSALSALSPLDGRYHLQLTALSETFSEFALIKTRVFVELEYLLFLSEQEIVPAVSAAEQTAVRKLAADFDLAAADKVKTWERTTKHDVKAVEYFLRDALTEMGSPLAPYVHLGLTSEDTNAICYGLLLQQAKEQLLEPQLHKLLQRLTDLARDSAEIPMLARTHGQPAVPTTFGKEVMNSAMRLYHALQALRVYQFRGKLTGAVGNFNAHVVVFPLSQTSWSELSQTFIQRLGLEATRFTTQIQPAENYTQFFGVLTRINNILLDLNQDIWRYISDGSVVQKVAAGQVGSSTMPHKVNPIDFENSEGNLGLANALLNHFSAKLPISRLQRDLSDSTVKRSFGSALGYCQLAYDSLLKGLSKISVDEVKLRAELNEHWEILTEAVQVALRAEGDSEGYEKLQHLAQGKKLTAGDYQDFVQSLKLTPALKARLLALTPVTYLGSAVELTHYGVEEITKYLQRYL